MYPFTFNINFAAVDFVSAEDGTHGFSTSGTHQSGKAGDLAGVSLEGDVMEHTGLIEVPGLQPHVALGAEFLGIQVVQSTAHHGGDQGILRHVADIFRNDVLAVPHNGDAVTQFKEFFQLVGDEQNGHALGLEAANRVHQLGDLLFAQRRRWVRP